MRPHIVSAILLLALVSCGQEAPNMAVSSSSPPQAARVATKEIAGQGPTVTVQRQLVKKVQLDLQVSDTIAAGEAINKLTAELGGHIGTMTTSNRSGSLFYEMTLRIPEARLDEAVNRIKKLASQVDRESLNTEDVTEQFVDLNARLKTLESTEAELRSLLADSRQRQQKAEDIMSVYRELTQIRSNIEGLRGQLNVMENLTSLATIDVNLAPVNSPARVVSSWKPFETIKGSLRTLVSVLTGLGDLAIMVVIVVLPSISVVVLALWLIVKGWRAVRARGGSLS